MTLILSALTPDGVLQVSDRRFTYTDAKGTVRSRNDEKNKAVLFCGRLLFGFAGRGDLGHKRRTDLWLAQTICDTIAGEEADQGRILQGIAERSTELFARAYRGERHAFIAAGWARFIAGAPPEGPADPGEFTPYLAVISNFHDESGEELSQVQKRFEIWVRPLLEGDKCFVWGVPKHLSVAESELLIRRVTHASKQSSPTMVAEYLAGQLKEVAARDPGVGKGLMISSLPRASLGNVDGIMALAGAPDAESQSFLYIPPSGETTIQLGPVTTCGNVITSNLEVGPIPEDWEPPEPSASLPEDPPGLLRRWYLTPIDGSGTDEDPYMARTHGLSGGGPIEGRGDGHPRHKRTVVLVSSERHEPMMDDPEIKPIADLADLDRPIDRLLAERQEWLRAAAAEHGHSAEGTGREALDAIGGYYQAGFDSSNFWTR